MRFEPPFVANTIVVDRSDTLMPEARVIAAPATAEPAWRRHLLAADVPESGLDDWVPAASRLVVLAPHPDDEVIACGGLIHAHALRQGQVTVVGVTDGEASHAGVPGQAASSLATLRRRERERGLAALGVKPGHISRLAIGDGQVGRGAARMFERVVAMLRPDDVVATTWRLDGHPDHEATGHVAARSCLLAGCRLIEAPVWMWHWAAPNDTRIDWPRLRAFRLSDAALRAKRRALNEHATQLTPRGNQWPPVLDAAIVERSRREFEYFFV